MEGKFPDWFTAYAKPNFEKYLIPLAGQDKLACLQLGVYTGDASVWLCENVLTAKECILVDVDTWQGSDEEVHKSIDFVSVYDTYLRKTGRFPQILKVTNTTVNFLIQFKSTQFDFIYIDADHTAVGVLLDAEFSWPLLNSGGLLAFDDYQWGQSLPEFNRPKLGIDLFLHRHIGEYEILEQGLQVWLRKL
jgi:predicted O-methyltransferase YrrM